jgi:hypothetical protein
VSTSTAKVGLATAAVAIGTQVAANPGVVDELGQDASAVSAELATVESEVASALGPQLPSPLSQYGQAAANPRLIERLAAWRDYVSRGGQFGNDITMRGGWVSRTQGAPWGTGYSSGFARWFQGLSQGNASISANRLAGRAFQEAVSTALGAPENTQVLSGGPITINTIPDALTQVALGEMKNYTSALLTYSPQIEAQINAAVSSGRTYVLIISPVTQVAQPLIDTIRSVNGMMLYFDPGTGAFTAAF